MTTADIDFMTLRSVCKDMEDVYVCRHKDNGQAYCKAKFCPVWKGLHTLKRDLDKIGADLYNTRVKEEIILIRR